MFFEVMFHSHVCYVFELQEDDILRDQIGVHGTEKY